MSILLDAPLYVTDAYSRDMCLDPASGAWSAAQLLGAVSFYSMIVACLRPREDGRWIRRRSRSSRAVPTVRRTRPTVSRTLALPAVLLTLLLAACADGNTSTSGSGLTVGDRAPTFELPAAAGGRASLDDFVGKKSVLLYFSMGPG
jgi:hypothetical protein